MAKYKVAAGTTVRHNGKNYEGGKAFPADAKTISKVQMARLVASGSVIEQASAESTGNGEASGGQAKD